MNDEDIQLVLDLIEQMYFGWEVDCCAQPPDELEYRAVDFLESHASLVNGEHSLSAIAHSRRLREIRNKRL